MSFIATCIFSSVNGRPVMNVTTRSASVMKLFSSFFNRIGLAMSSKTNWIRSKSLRRVKPCSTSLRMSESSGNSYSMP